MRNLNTLILVTATALLALPVFAQSQQQSGLSLADIAKKNRSEKTKKVITNDDLPARPAEGNSSAGGADSAGPNGALVQDHAQTGDTSGSAGDQESADKDAKGAKKPAPASADAYAKAKAEVDALKQRESDLKRGIDEMAKNRDGNEAHQKLVDETLAEQRAHLQETQTQLEQKQKELDSMTPPQPLPEKKDQ
jgi:hypothetical protein